ncbi:Rho GTPase activation protein [Mycena floridula]|nr:Rho GTPase activation protein [Mycena floridula]
MPEDGYSSSTTGWDTTDNSELHNSSSSSYGRSQMRPPQEAEESGLDGSSLRRGSAELNSVASSSKWQSPAAISESHESQSTAVHEGNLVDGGFDENVLRALCDMDCAVPLLMDRIKQSMVSCREASVFFKKRAAIEEEYGKSMQKLARATNDVYAMNDGKAGTYVSAWQASMKIHEAMADNRLRFAHRLNEMSDELSTLAKEVDKNRKGTKDLATRYERALQESEGVTEKSKNRLDITSEELERVLLQKEGESFKDNTVQARPGGVGSKRAIGKAVAKGGLLLKGKNPGNIQRQEDDIRSRMSNASDTFRKALTDTQTMRQEYFNFQLPRILRSLKECTDEVDLGTQYHLTRYAFLFESIVLSDGATLVPPKDDAGISTGGLKNAIEMIDNRGDFKTFMQNYAYAHGNSMRGPRREGPSDEGFLPPLPRHDHSHGHPILSPPAIVNGGKQSPVADKGRPTFGVGLAEQMARDDVEVPLIVSKCCEAIEKHGLESQGIYRVSGTSTKVQALKQRLDKDLDAVDLDTPEWSSDINNVASVLKLWFRELPDSLLTVALHQGFIDAAKIENERLRHIRLHERVNDLPDANYSTLKYFFGHLYRINQHATENSMTMQNLAIVFGPTLFAQVAPVMGSNGQLSSGGMADTAYQNTAIETILNHYNDIFVDEGE